MQLLALSSQGPLQATSAEKQKNYTCPECQEIVRVRSGPHRQPHFYHVHKTSSCRQHQKSAEHIQAQLMLLSLLPAGECSLERPFPSISRIADAVWETAQIVFEIQCSPITQEEVKARTADYQSIGMKIVWILHDKRFNRRSLGSAESHLRQQTCYYTNCSASGLGMIYDQFEIIEKEKRLFKGPALPICIEQPLAIESCFSNSELNIMARRAKSWSLSFENDLFCRMKKAPVQSWQSLIHLQKKFQSYPTIFKPWIAVKQLYKLIFHHLLRSCSQEI